MDEKKYEKKCKFSDLVSQTITKIEKLNDVELVFYTKDIVYRMYHDYQCCESVYIESITGDLEDLIGSPILRAVEEVSETDEEQPDDDETLFYHTLKRWTFYKLATQKGYVDIRWCGSSNGYYSVEVDVFELPTYQYDGKYHDSIKVTIYE